MSEEKNPHLHDEDTTTDGPKATGKDSGRAAASEPQQDNRLTKAQKLFFLLVVLFTVFLLFLKLVWEPKMRDRARENPSIPSWDPGDYGDFNPGDYNPEDYNPEDYTPGDYDPGESIDWPDGSDPGEEPAQPFGPQPE
jgi:hypothetical protein